MRIIGGKWKGKSLRAPHNIPARPTTDFAKEALFQLLSNRIELDNIRALYLCCGTGSLSVELLSRGAAEVVSVESHYNTCKHLYALKKQLQCHNWSIVKQDIFKFLENQADNHYHLIICDPPYAHPLLPQIPQLVFNGNLLHTNGYFVLEHGKNYQFLEYPNFEAHKQYGEVNFSFFTH